MTINPPVAVDVVCAADRQMLAGLHAACFAEGWSAQSFGDLLDSCMTKVFIARGDAGIAAGFALLRNVAGEAEILTLGVLPEHRKRHIGAALVHCLCNWAAQHGANSIFLEVREANVAALGLYGNAGFRRMGLRRDYYRNDDGSTEHAVVMRYSAQLR